MIIKSSSIDWKSIWIRLLVISYAMFLPSLCIGKTKNKYTQYYNLLYLFNSLRSSCDHPCKLNSALNSFQSTYLIMQALDVCREKHLNKIQHSEYFSPSSLRYLLPRFYFAFSKSAKYMEDL